MLLLRVLAILIGGATVALLLAYSVTRNRKYLAWGLWIGKISIGLLLILGLLYTLERLILI